MTTDDNDFLPNFCSKKYYCEWCDYRTSKKSSYRDHLLSAKHVKATENNKNLLKICSNKYCCEKCDKIYNDRAGLWRHKKKCNFDDITEPNDVPEHISIEVIMELIKDNKELKQLVIEQSKTIQQIALNGTHNTTTTNSHNKTFNLQFFLNETCKDAMNIMEFVDSIKLQLSDLENVGQVGYVEGISNIIVKNLKALDINKRPVHCTDKKREVMYVKDENKWEKENDDNKKIRKMIKYIASKNQRMLPKFKEAHPDCNKSISRFSDKYNKILVESMGGSGDNDLEKEDKIIRNISKNILVDKES